MSIVPDKQNEWHFVNASFLEIDNITGNSELTKTQTEALNRLLALKFSDSNQKTLEVTHLVKHEIIVEGPPRKQRYYPVSPLR